MNFFKNKKTLITGANKGIGRAIAENLLEKGAKIIGTATNKKNVNIINTFLNKKGKGILMNFDNPVSIEKSLKNAHNELKNIDILINNAGITNDKLLFFYKNEEWQKICSVNLTSVFFLSKLVLRGMIKKCFGRIINIGSLVGHTGNIGQTGYAATKAGLIGFSKSLSKEVAKYNITVNVIAPGFIESDMTNNLEKDKKQKILSQIPLNRLGTTKDIAYTVSFLASDKASYITGETINVNGGIHMM